MTGRAYPLFDIAQMILQKPERHAVAFSIKKNAEGKPIQPLFICALDDTLWLTEDEAIAHVLRKHFNTFYQAERTATEPPKGKYTFVAQCGMSGVILGPPNYHDYQNQLRKLHAERFSRMPFEVYKSRVKIVRDDEVVKKWVEDQSWKTEYLCLNMPEPLKLPNMEAVEKHFREHHKENIVKPVESYKLSGVAARGLRCQPLTRSVRSIWEDQRRFPLQIATVLSQQFASHGLQFFKVNKTITHVSVARPHYLDMAATPVSEGVNKIVDYINSHPKCNRRLLIEALAPTPPPAPIPVSPAVPEVVPPPASTESPSEAPAGAEPTQAATPPVQPPSRPEDVSPTPEQTAVIADLHWLIHQGHVLEFANGTLETAKKPVPKPPKPEAKPAEKAEGPEGASPVPGESATGPTPPGEAVAPPTAPGEPAQSPEIPVPPAEASPAATETEAPAEPTPSPSVTEPPPAAPSGEPTNEAADTPTSEAPPDSPVAHIHSQS
jgi:hypothetical protein